jgi:hypothetical protein
MENFQEVKKSLIEQLKDSDAFKCDVKQVMLEDVIDAQTWDELQDVICDSIFSYLDNGILLPDGHYKNDNTKFTIVDGKVHGEFVSYWSDGQVKVKCNYVNGELHGQYLLFSSYGKLLCKYFYENGELMQIHSLS